MILPWHVWTVSSRPLLNCHLMSPSPYQLFITKAWSIWTGRPCLQLPFLQVSLKWIQSLLSTTVVGVLNIIKSIWVIYEVKCWRQMTSYIVGRLTVMWTSAWDQVKCLTVPSSHCVKEWRTASISLSRYIHTPEQSIPCRELLSWLLR